MKKGTRLKYTGTQTQYWIIGKVYTVQGGDNEGRVLVSQHKEHSGNLLLGSYPSIGSEWKLLPNRPKYFNK